MMRRGLMRMSPLRRSTFTRTTSSRRRARTVRDEGAGGEAGKKISCCNCAAVMAASVASSCSPCCNATCRIASISRPRPSSRTSSSTVLFPAPRAAVALRSAACPAVRARQAFRCRGRWHCAANASAVFHFFEDALVHAEFPPSITSSTSLSCSLARSRTMRGNSANTADNGSRRAACTRSSSVLAVFPASRRPRRRRRALA